MKFGIVVFPGTWSDTDCHHALVEILGQDAKYVWHETTDLSEYDSIILPGGFSYGDYLRPGAIARFSPIIREIEIAAQNGKPVLGICNGFQILCEAKLLPGALVRNSHLQFRCTWTHIKAENIESPFTNKASIGQILRIPISHGEGNYVADEITLGEIEQNGQILLRYCTENGDVNEIANPNGSYRNIAGVTNKAGNVLGMMPHPERCCETVLGGTDGRVIFESIISSLKTGQYIR
jgi:phosphoribosylformylglycinamidine synthase